MKYNITKLNNGNYAVGSNKTYYPSTETSDKNEALKSAYLKSMFWYQDKLEQTYNEAVEKGLLEEDSMNDYLC